MRILLFIIVFAALALILRLRTDVTSHTNQTQLYEDHIEKQSSLALFLFFASVFHRMKHDNSVTSLGLCAVDAGARVEKID